MLNFWKNSKSNREESDLLVRKALALAVMEGTAKPRGNYDEKQYFDLLEQAISICPDNSEPYWMIINSLHIRGADEKAFEYFSKMPNQKIYDFDMIDTIPAIIGMLVSVGKEEIAYNYLNGVLYEFSSEGKEQQKDLFLSFLKFEIPFHSLEYGQKIFEMLKRIDPTLTIGCDEKFGATAKWLFNHGKATEALTYLEGVLIFLPGNPLLLSLEKEIRHDIADDTMWNSLKSDDDFLRYLFRRLAHRFHPDLVTDEKDRAEKEKIMKEINRAYSDRALQKLKDIAERHAPQWKKYLHKEQP